MILELAGHGPDLIQVTAQYSNAVLVALLPYFSDATHKLDLPVPQPITMQHVVGGGVMPYRYPNGDMLSAGIEIQGERTRRRWYLGYMFGHINQVELRPSYFTIQDPDDLRWCYGKIRMTKDEAIQMARDTIKKLGIPLEDVFAEQEPRVTLPATVHATNTLPYYRIEWLDPRGGSSTVHIGVNADAKRVERIYFGVGDDNLHRPPPKIDVITPVVGTRPRSNPEYAWKLIPIVLRAVDDYGKTLGLPIPRPLTTNHVARFQLSDNGGWPHSVLELSNGWQFVYRNSMVNGYYAPDNLFWFPRSNQRTLIKDFAGRWKMTEVEAIKLIGQTLAKLNYPANLVHTDFAPKIRKPDIPGIPRYFIVWEYLNETQDDIESKVEAEVDADNGELKSLYFDNKAFWNKPPQIDVPIALPATPVTNAAMAKPAAKPGLQRKAPQRPLTPFKLPQERKPH
jgi:hypothetical protein